MDILRNNGVIAFPTDTLYGIATQITSEIGYNRIYDIKGQDCTNRKFRQSYNFVQIFASIKIIRFFLNCYTFYSTNRNNYDVVYTIFTIPSKAVKVQSQLLFVSDRSVSCYTGYRRSKNIQL